MKLRKHDLASDLTIDVPRPSEREVRKLYRNMQRSGWTWTSRYLLIRDGKVTLVTSFRSGPPDALGTKWCQKNVEWATQSP